MKNAVVRKIKIGAALLVCLGWISACGNGIGDGGYTGKTLGRVNGSIEIPAASVSLKAEDIKNPLVGVGWMSRTNGPRFVEVLPVDAVFPLSFKMGVYLPPSEEALLRVGDATLAIGMIGLVDDLNNSGTYDNPNFAPGIGPDRVWGMVEKYVLLYVEQPTSVELAASFGVRLEAPVEKGMHLMQVLTGSPCVALENRMDCPEGTLREVSFDTPVTIQLRPELRYMEIPNVF